MRPYIMRPYIQRPYITPLYTAPLYNALPPRRALLALRALAPLDLDASVRTHALLHLVVALLELADVPRTVLMQAFLE